jgi:hypothetical protein
MIRFPWLVVRRSIADQINQLASDAIDRMVAAAERASQAEIRALEWEKTAHEFRRAAAEHAARAARAETRLTLIESGARPAKGLH